MGFWQDKDWFFYALGSAVLWGLAYAMSEKAMKGQMTPAFFIFSVAVAGTVCYGAYLLFQNEFISGIQSLFTEKNVLFYTGVAAASFVFGNLFIFKAINEKNATSANLIEITYPVFTALFVFLLFKEIQITIYTIIGAALIFSGVAVIFLKT